MKKSLLTMMTILVIISTQAQNWQLVHSNNVQWYKGFNNYLKVIFTDSVKYINGDSIFYFPVTLGAKYLYYNGSHGHSKANFNSPWWTGNKMVLKADGSQLFFNAEDDTITFPQKMDLKDSFELVHFKNGNFVFAEVTSITADTVLGSIDSVKTILIKTYNKNKIKINLNGISEKTIKISKHNGFVNIIPLFSILDTSNKYAYEVFTHKYALYNYSLIKPKKFLTISDVFDFNKEDYFEIRNANSGDIKNNKIIDKSIMGDTIKYRIKQIHSSNKQWYIFLDSSQFNYYIYHKDSLITNKYPEQNLYGINEWPFGYLQISYYEGQCGLTSIRGDRTHVYNIKDTFTYLTFERVLKSFTYTEHLGLVDSTQEWPNGDANDTYSYSLISTRNNYCSYGWAVGTNNSAADLKIKLSPNPVVSDFRIEFNEPIESLQYFNLVGQEIFLETNFINSHIAIVNTKFLMNGLYIIKINNKYTSRFLKANN